MPPLTEETQVDDMKLIGPRRVLCQAGVPARIVRSLWTNVPSEFTVEVDPPETTGVWVERSSFVPAGVSMSERSRGRVAPQLRFRRKYMDSSFEIEITTDRPATLTVSRSRR